MRNWSVTAAALTGLGLLLSLPLTAGSVRSQAGTRSDAPSAPSTRRAHAAAAPTTTPATAPPPGAGTDADSPPVALRHLDLPEPAAPHVEHVERVASSVDHIHGGQPPAPAARPRRFGRSALQSGQRAQPMERAPGRYRRHANPAGPLDRALDFDAELGPLRTPWHPRRRYGVVVDDLYEPLPRPGALSPRRLKALGLRGGPRSDLPVEAWPPEPDSPEVVMRTAFRRALRAVCPADVPAAVVHGSADAMLAAAAEFGVDVFTLGALARHQSGCRPRSEDSWGLGLTRVSPAMHRSAIQRNQYRYRIAHGSDFVAQRLSLGGVRLTRKALLSARDNARFAAATLRVFSAQCGAIDSHFHSVPHRHPVSHVIFGDRVRSALPETQILTERRRLLQYYRQHAPRPVAPRTPDGEARLTAGTGADFHGVRLGSPLDGAPRLVIGLLGDPRDGGRRTHYGVDLPASDGEPVRAVADGVVTFAGVELHDGQMLEFAPEAVADVPLARLGKRGVYVRIEHAAGLHSVYVHLADYRVQHGQRVRRGDVLGTIGLSGVHTSDTHLHLGLFDGTLPLDPMQLLSPYLRANPVPLPDPQAPALARRPRRSRHSEAL